MQLLVTHKKQRMCQKNLLEYSESTNLEITHFFLTCYPNMCLKTKMNCKTAAFPNYI